MIRLRTLGECIIEVDGVLYTPELDALFAALLYLTAERGRRVPRAELAMLLWPYHEEHQARHCLRQLLYRMRHVGIPLDGTRDTVTILPTLVAPTFAAEPTAERLVAERDAGTLRFGTVLPGYWPRVSDAFGDWVEQLRTSMEMRVRRVLLEVTRAHRLRGEWEHADALAMQCLRLDPLNEEATFARTEAMAMLGNKNDALTILDRYIAEMTETRPDQLVPAVVFRQRIAERFPARTYATRADQSLCGRGDLVEAFIRALARARVTRGGGLVFTGAPGSGKTRLVHELVRTASIQGAHPIRIVVQESDRHRPMSLFADAVPQLRSLQGAIGISPDCVPFLARLTDPHLVATSSEDPLDPHWIAARIRQAVVDLFDAVASETTVVLLIEDAHWLDTQSWATIAAIGDILATRKLLLVLTSRDHFPSADTPQRCVAQFQSHELPPLSPAASNTLIQAIARSNNRELTSDESAWCVTAGEGNPLFLRELVLHRCAGHEWGTVPPSLTALLDARLAGLSDRSRRLVDAIAIADGATSVDEIRRVMELNAHELASALAEITSAGVLNESSPTVTLCHELIKVRVQAQMSPVIAQLFHARIASVISAGPLSLGSVDRLLAATIHWRAAGQMEEAADSLSNAADIIERLGALSETARLLSAAVELTARPTMRRKLLRRWTRVLSWEGRWQQVAIVFEHMGREVSDTAEISDDSALDSIAQIDALFRLGHSPTALLTRCTRLAHSGNLSRTTRVNAARKALSIASNCGMDLTNLPILRSIDALLAENHDACLPIECLALMRATLLGDAEGVEIISARIFASIQFEASAFTQAQTLLILGEARRIIGHSAEAKRIYELTYKESHRFGMTYIQARAAERLSLVSINSGDAALGRQWFDRYAMLSGSSSESWDRQAILCNCARLALLERDYEAAKNLVQQYETEIQSVEGVIPWQTREFVTIRAETSLATTTEPLPTPLVDALTQTHVQMRRAPLHDRTAEIYCLALTRAGRSDEAAYVLGDYLRCDRICAVAWEDRIERLPNQSSAEL